jgi:hypothetical protein
MRLYPQASALLLLFAGACTVPNHAASPPQASGPANGPLWHNDGGGFIPSSGSVASNVPCQSVSLNLRLDRSAPEPARPKLIGTPSPCRNNSTFNGYLRSTLFVEGLDTHGARLFVATGINPLHQDLEAPPPPSGGQFSWHAVDTKMAVVTTLIQAPLTPALVRLRWFDVDENLQPHELGEMDWSGG